MNIEREFKNLKKNINSAKGNIARGIGIGLVFAAPVAALAPDLAWAQQKPLTSSEDPFIPEKGGKYQIIIDESVFNNPKADELRRLLRLGYFEIGDCAEIEEAISVASIENPNSTLNGGSEPVEYRHVFSRCEVPAPVVPVASASAPIGSCVNLEVPLGTASGNGATVNEVTVTRDVILHGDGKINGEDRFDNSGASGLIERVHATPANPAHIEVANPAWGLDVAAFCNPTDMEANVAQGVANLQSQGMRADVLNWPGPNQLGGLVNPAVAPAYSPAVVNSTVTEANLYSGMGWTVNYNDLANGRFTIVAGDGVLIDSQGNKFNILSGNPRVGTMVVFSGIGSENLPWGGHVWSGISKGALKSYVENINNQIKMEGCSNGCDGANTYLWDGTNVNLLTPWMLAQLTQ